MFANQADQIIVWDGHDKQLMHGAFRLLTRWVWSVVDGEMQHDPLANPIAIDC